MSELKTNKISTNDTNNVAIDTALGLKTYTTSQKNALTSVAGDLVYDTDLNKAQIHNGTSWGDIGETDRALDIDFLVVAGGGSGYWSYGGGGGGAGAQGTDSVTQYGASGGVGQISTIITTAQATTYSVGEVSGSDVYYAGGGGGGLYRADPPSLGRKGAGGLGGGGDGGINSAAGNQLSAQSATVNTGGGGGGQGNAGSAAGSGGSGVVILKWLTDVATMGATRTGLTDSGIQTDGDYSYIIFTAGTGTVTFS